MGYLLRFVTPDAAEAFQLLWEGFEIVSRPAGRTECQTAEKIEDKLIAVSTSSTSDVVMKCGNCKQSSPLDIVDQFNWWRVVTTRVLNADAQPIFFEDAELQYIEKVLAEVKPPQPRVRYYNRMWSMIDEMKKDWVGSEVDLRKRLEPPPAPEAPEQPAPAEQPSTRAPAAV